MCVGVKITVTSSPVSFTFVPTVTTTSTSAIATTTSGMYNNNIYYRKQQILRGTKLSWFTGF